MDHGHGESVAAYEALAKKGDAVAMYELGLLLSESEPSEAKS